MLLLLLDLLHSSHSAELEVCFLSQVHMMNLFLAEKNHFQLWVEFLIRKLHADCIVFDELLLNLLNVFFCLFFSVILSFAQVQTSRPALKFRPCSWTTWEVTLTTSSTRSPRKKLVSRRPATAAIGRAVKCSAELRWSMAWCISVEIRMISTIGKRWAIQAGSMMMCWNTLRSLKTICSMTRWIQRITAEVALCQSHASLIRRPSQKQFSRAAKSSAIVCRIWTEPTILVSWSHRHSARMEFVTVQPDLSFGPHRIARICTFWWTQLHRECSSIRKLKPLRASRLSIRMVISVASQRRKKLSCPAALWTVHKSFCCLALGQDKSCSVSASIRFTTCRVLARIYTIMSLISSISSSTIRTRDHSIGQRRWSIYCSAMVSCRARASRRQRRKVWELN